MKCLPTLACALLLTAISQMKAVEIQGVSLPATVSVSGTSLALNGAGLRTFNLLMVPIKVYVAALYAPAPLRSAQAVESFSGPLQFDFTFLRAVGKEDVAKAWSAQFAQSVSYTYTGYGKDLDAFIAMFGALPEGGVEQVRFVGTNTVVSDCGTVRGTIPGRDFQKAFLSLWFGPKPVSHKLRDRLLGVIPPA
jgi:Chalcone isomerase-like